MKSGKKLDLSLYLVLDANLCKTPEGMAETARKAVEGGCTVVQLRAPEWKKKKQLRAAFLLKVFVRHNPAQQQDELVAAQTGHDIAAAHSTDQPPGLHDAESVDITFFFQLLFKLFADGS